MAMTSNACLYCVILTRSYLESQAVLSSWKRRILLWSTTTSKAQSNASPLLASFQLFFFHLVLINIVFNSCPEGLRSSMRRWRWRFLPTWQTTTICCSPSTTSAASPSRTLLWRPLWATLCVHAFSWPTFNASTHTLTCLILPSVFLPSVRECVCLFLPAVDPSDAAWQSTHRLVQSARLCWKASTQLLCTHPWCECA